MDLKPDPNLQLQTQSLDCSPALAPLGFLACSSLSGKERSLHVCTFHLLYLCLIRHSNAPTHIKRIGMKMGKTNAAVAHCHSQHVWMPWVAGYVSSSEGPRTTQDTHRVDQLRASHRIIPQPAFSPASPHQQLTW